jgi:hypothetical protein
MESDIVKFVDFFSNFIKCFVLKFRNSSYFVCVAENYTISFPLRIVYHINSLSPLFNL